MYPYELFDFVRAGMVPNSIGIKLLNNGGDISKYADGSYPSSEREREIGRRLLMFSKKLEFRQF